MSGSSINAMAGGTASAARVSAQAGALLPLATARPGEALARARAVLAAGPSFWDASVAHQVVGIVLRDFGDVAAAIQELRTALRLARSAKSADREADVLATLGIALVYAGRTKAGLASLDSAATRARGGQAGRVLMRRGGALWVLGRHREALSDLRRAVSILRRDGDMLWAGRALTARALVNLSLGSTDRADADLGSADRLFAATSQELEAAYATHNRGLAAFRSGDLPTALSYFDDAAHRYEALAAPMPDLSIDRCAVLLAAGLPYDAHMEADAAVRRFEKLRGQATKKAELLLAAANAALAAADHEAALQRAQAARRLFGSQQRTWWHAKAELVLLRAKFAAGLAALALGRAVDADRQLATAARARARRGPALSRLTGWLAEALRAEAPADSRRQLSACRGGLDLLDEHRLTLGGCELRAQATARGAELAELAQRCALRSGKPRLLLAWSERWRATVLAVPPVRPVDDAELQADLTAARDVTSRLEKARAAGANVAAMQREQLRLERAVRTRVMRTRGAVRAPTTKRGPRGPGVGAQTGTRRAGGRAALASADQGFDAALLLAELGTGCLVQIVDVAGDLHLLVCGNGRVQHFAAGRTEDAAREVNFARFGLNRLAHNRSAHASDASGQASGALAVLAETGRRLEEILLGNARGHLRDGPVVVVPPGRLHAVPWALLPSLRDRSVSVAPSARAWMRARAAVPPQRDEVVLVRGPGVGGWGTEVPVLAVEYGDATVLADGTATAARVLEAIDGATLVHIAAHGRFRADSPMFSSLRLDDGPLTVHDLERLRRAPFRMILPSCASGLLVPARADELLGLTSTLVPLGTVGILASVVPVNDKAAAELMLAVHRGLRLGGTLSGSLRDARAGLGDDPVLTATGWSFIALGAG